MENENRLQQVLDCLFPVFMTNEGGKRPASTASTTDTCLSGGSIRMPKVPRYLHLVNCFQERLVDFEGHVGRVLAEFPTI